MPLTSVLNYLTYVCPAGSGAGGVDGMDEELGGQGKATDAPAGRELASAPPSPLSLPRRRRCSCYRCRNTNDSITVIYGKEVAALRQQR